MVLKNITFLLAILAVVAGKNVTVKNMYFDPIRISVTGQGETVLQPGETVTANLAEDSSGDVVAHDGDCEGADCSLPGTTAQFSFDPVYGDTYSISLVQGFNKVMKVVPVGNVSQCKAISCQVNLLPKCPEEHQVFNSDDVLVSCARSPALFEQLCPQATNTISEQKLFTCPANSYQVLYG